MLPSTLASFSNPERFSEHSVIRSLELRKELMHVTNRCNIVVSHMCPQESKACWDLKNTSNKTSSNECLKSVGVQHDSQTPRPTNPHKQPTPHLPVIPQCLSHVGGLEEVSMRHKGPPLTTKKLGLMHFGPCC